ncbi:MAG TPA: DUF3090 family protein [Actinocrinis sp.]|uniref:DUF3090 family protein n=1 Tax=Actinocrinis sp. TaxID=1920516 RepID=UPI002DDD9049|nr:DUF3090 family protein [Actinocrinis sp.]HEV2347751.1 DUF3090 family protein [Actinocrinis sp.]
MPRHLFVYDPPERFVAGTVGEPGSRSFFLQARSGRRVTSVSLEKEQVALLAERLEELLDEIVRRTGGVTAVPAATPTDLTDNDPLEQPILEEFRVGSLALAWDEPRGKIVIEAGAITEDENPAEPLSDDQTAEAPDVLRVRLTGGQARAFAARAQAVVSAGRPPCPLCDLPLDPEGHVCPRQNGYRRRTAA